MALLMHANATGRCTCTYYSLFHPWYAISKLGAEVSFWGNHLWQRAISFQQIISTCFLVSEWLIWARTILAIRGVSKIRWAIWEKITSHMSCIIFIPFHAQGQSLRVCWCEPSHVRRSSICMYKHAPGFKLRGASSTTSAGWSGPRLGKQPLLHLIYFCKISHLFSSESLLGTHDCPFAPHTELHDSPCLPKRTLMPANLDPQSLDPQFDSVDPAK